MANIKGTQGDDQISGTYGADQIQGDAGNDGIGGGGGSDTLFGGDGQDWINGNAGYDLIYGDAGNDRLFGDEGNDTLSGGAGADTLTGGQGDDLYMLGTDADTVVEQADGGIDEVQVGDNMSGTDYYGQPYHYGAYSLVGTNIENLTATGFKWFKGTGNAKDNVIKGSIGGNWINADAGNDTVILSQGYAYSESEVRLGTGNDVLTVGAAHAGYVEVHAGDGNDQLTFGKGIGVAHAGSGDDTVWGGTASDMISDGAGADKVSGGAGHDVLATSLDWYPTSIVDGYYVPNYDVSVAADDGAVDWKWGGEGNDSIAGNAGDFLIGGVGDDSYHIRQDADTTVVEFAGGGTDTVVILGKAHTLDVDIENLRFTYETKNADTGSLNMGGGFYPAQYSHLPGETGAHGIGHAGHNRLEGWADRDTLEGLEGDDTLLGGNGADSLLGGEGNDLIEAGLGHGDVGDGGAGHDSLSAYDDATLRGGTGDDTIEGFDFPDFFSYVKSLDGAGGDGDDALHGASGWDLLAGDAGNDTVSGDEGNDTLAGGSENDLLEGGTGQDRMQGDDGADTLQGGEGGDTLTGGIGTDSLDGGASDDELQGGAGADTLQGGEGNDLLWGGVGPDQMLGGAGADTFRFQAGESGTGAKAMDHVLDFVRGQDVLDFQDFATPLSLSAGAVANAVWQKVMGDGTLKLFVDHTGDAKADMAIAVHFGDGLLPGAIGAGDFLF